MFNFMKPSRIDLLILEELRSSPEGTTIKRLSEKLKKDYAQIFRRLKKMCRYNVVEEIKSKPSIYKLNLNASNRITMMDVICPKCHRDYFLPYLQMTKSCEYCKTKKGDKRFRFYIYGKRIKQLRRLGDADKLTTKIQSPMSVQSISRAEAEICQS